MKKVFVTLFLSVTVFATSAFATGEPGIDPKIVSAFQKEFSFAQNVKWQEKGELIQVTFSLFEHGFVAWYNSKAELVSTARNILYMQLPLSVIRALQEYYAEAELSGIVEFTSDGETYYQIRAEVKKKKYLLKATPYGHISVVKRIK